MRCLFSHSLSIIVVHIQWRCFDRVDRVQGDFSTQVQWWKFKLIFNSWFDSVENQTDESNPRCFYRLGVSETFKTTHGGFGFISDPLLMWLIFFNILTDWFFLVYSSGMTTQRTWLKCGLTSASGITGFQNLERCIRMLPLKAKLVC